MIDNATAAIDRWGDADKTLAVQPCMAISGLYVIYIYRYICRDAGNKEAEGAAAPPTGEQLQPQSNTNLLNESIFFSFQNIHFLQSNSCSNICDVQHSCKC